MDNLFSHHLTLGFRRDGRRPHEIRHVSCKLACVPNANGSASFQIGNTFVIAAVYGPQNAKNRESRQKRTGSTLIVRSATASFATSTHRESSRNRRQDRQLCSMIKSTFDTLIMDHLYPHCTIEVVLEILQSDGGEKCAAVNATTLALIDAGIALKEYGVACSAGYIDGHDLPLLDLNYYEKSGTVGSKIKTFASKKVISKSRIKGRANKAVRKLQQIEQAQEQQSDQMEQDEDEEDGAVLDKKKEEEVGYCSGQLTLVVMPVSSKIVTMQMQSIIDIARMERLLQICQKGCKDIHKIMKHAIKEHSFELMQHRGFINR